MQSLSDLINQKRLNEPPEIAQIKEFVQKNLGIEVSINMQKFSITIIAGSASQAGALRQVLHKLKSELDTDKKLFIRIG